MLTIDGKLSEGGGQVLRTSLALSLFTGTPFHIVNIRARRRKPGPLHQHVMAVTAATQIGRATTEGGRRPAHALLLYVASCNGHEVT